MAHKQCTKPLRKNKTAIDNMLQMAVLRVLQWSWKRDLNTRPAHYECAALPTELFQQKNTTILYTFLQKKSREI